jgi:GT2 family glycosyltransferase/peptidoglycan/xylan/chitin deacetylase (PgdA/CDA1 family)
LTRFSVVIPTYERRETVLRTVAALGDQEFEDFEVVVAVDGSSDGTAEALRRLDTRFPLRVVEQPNGGRATAVNAGAGAAQGELLLILDDDMSADPRLIAEHDRSHREGADAVMGDLPLDPSSPPNLLSWGVGFWARTRCERLSVPGAEIRLDDLLTGQMSVSRQTYEQLDGFDVSFTRDGLFGGEDIDFGYRLLGAGKRVVFNPRAITYQYYDVGPAEYLRRARETGRSDWELVAKHPELSERLENSPHFTSRRSRLLLQPLLALPAAISWPLRAGACALVRSRLNTPRLRRLYFAVRTLEYLRGRRAAERQTAGGSAVVLAYHSLADLRRDPVLAEYGIEPKTFAAQLDMLVERGHRFVDLDLFLAAVDGRAPLPSKATLVTFDDAYADLLPAATEILSQRNIPAVVFAVGGQIGGANEWDHHLGASALPLLDAEGLRALAEAGIEIGSHSVNHPQLTKISFDEAKAELRDSAAQIEAAGLPRPRTFAYPHGEWNPPIAAAAAAAGYEAAFTIDHGRARTGCDRFALPRIEVLASDSPRSLRLKLATAGWPNRIRDRLLRRLGAKR